MAKRKQKDVVDVAPDTVVTEPEIRPATILVEEPNGGEPYEVETGFPVHPFERVVDIAGCGRFEHVSARGERWVYRHIAK